MKAFNFFITFLLIIPSLSAGDRLSNSIKNALDEIGRNHYEVLRVGFGNFTYEYSTIGGSFSRFIEEELKEAIAQSDYFELFVQDALENLDPSFKEVYNELFSVKGLEALIRGRYFNERDKLRLSLEVISFKTGYMVGKTEVMINIKDIPENVSMLPPDFLEALKLNMELEDVIEARDEEFVVRATTNRGDGAVFHHGEEMVIRFFANTDAYLKVYHIDVNGKISLIFPNKYYSNNFVPKQTLRQIPGKGDPFAFVLGEPYGTEFIKVMASTKQFKDIEESFKSLGSASKKMIIKGLSVEQRQGDIAETLIKYTIVD